MEMLGENRCLRRWKEIGEVRMLRIRFSSLTSGTSGAG